MLLIITAEMAKTVKDDFVKSKDIIANLAQETIDFRETLMCSQDYFIQIL